MKLTSGIIFLLPAALALTSCLGVDEPTDRTVRETVEILPETCVTFPFMDYYRHSPVENLVMVDSRGDKSYVGVNEIKDFEWERGYGYTLEIDKTIIASPPMDGGNVGYSLRKVMERRKDPSFAPSAIEVTAVSDVVYAPGTPADIYILDWAHFSVDEAGHIEPTRHNLLTQVTFDGSLGLVYTLREDSPLYCRWNYIADKVYVCSPFSNRLRLIEPEGYPRFYPLETTILTPGEYARIVSEGRADDKFEYALYVYSAENLALQKLSVVFERI